MIAQFCIYCSILWTILERLGLQMIATSGPGPGPANATDYQVKSPESVAPPVPRPLVTPSGSRDSDGHPDSQSRRSGPGRGRRLAAPILGSRVKFQVSLGPGRFARARAPGPTVAVTVLSGRRRAGTGH